MPKVIINSTPIISICHLNRFDILKKLYGDIYLPEAVYSELSAKPDSICKQILDDSIDEGWVHVRRINNALAKSLYKAQLHDGEVEVMILAKEINADLVVIDDLNARKHANYLHLKVTGTLGLLIKAKRLGYIDSLRNAFEVLLRHHIYISEKLFHQCLKLVNED